MKHAVIFLYGLLLSVVLKSQAQSLSDINSVYDDINPVVTADGNTLYFTRINHPDNVFGEEDSEDIWVTRRTQENKWLQPEHHASLNRGQYNAVLGVANEGNTLLLNGVFDAEGNPVDRRGISLAHRNGEIWETPQEIIIPKMKWKSSKISAYLSPDGQTLLIGTGVSEYSDSGDIFLVERLEDGAWSEPYLLPIINTTFSEMTPCLSADGNTLYFASDRHSSGRTHIYKSNKLGVTWDKWSEPVLIAAAGKGSWQAYFSINPTDTTAYYSSTFRSKGHADIYHMYVGPKKYVTFTDKSVDKNGIPFHRDSYMILANGKNIDSLTIKSDGTYIATLPAGPKYIITRQYVSRYWQNAVSANTKQGEEHYVIVSGKVLDEYGRPYPRESYTLLANDQPVSDIVVSPSGEYNARLPLPIPEGGYVLKAKFPDKVISLKTVTE